MPSSRGRTGRSAEIVAAAELGRCGYRIIASNYRCREGEIDFVADDGDTLAFIEVRCKTTDLFGSPAESITKSKIRKLGAAAEHFLREHAVGERSCRFDVVEVVLQDGRLKVSNVIKNAFSL